MTRAVNNKGDGNFFGRERFCYRQDTDTYLCPAGKTLRRRQTRRNDKLVIYMADPADCGGCAKKPYCTEARRRTVSRLLDEDALIRMHQRATADAMKLRRATVEHPFATLKYRIFGHPRLLLRGTSEARTEISLAAMAYNIIRMVNILGAFKLVGQLRAA